MSVVWHSHEMSKSVQRHTPLVEVGGGEHAWEALTDTLQIADEISSDLPSPRAQYGDKTV